MSTHSGLSRQRLTQTLIEFAWLLRLQAAMLDEQGDHIDATDLRERASVYERTTLAL